MDQRVRRVLARYFEEPGDNPPDMNKSWMEYLDGKSKPMVIPDNPVLDMLKNKKHLDTSFNTTNPYDYESPSDAPKDQKDSPPFENVISEPTQEGYFNFPRIFSEGGVLEEWAKSQEQDFTQDEDEQGPAMSLTRKRCASGVIPKELLAGFTIPGSDFYEFIMRNKVAATLGDIVDKDFHYKNDLKLQRAEKCQAVWTNKNNPNQFEHGLFIFKVSSPGSEHGAHNVYLQFLRDDEKPASKYVDYPVHIGCTCPSFLYSGAQYYAVRDGYMYMPAFKPDLTAPRSQDQYTKSVSTRYPKGKNNPGRGLNSRVCKHILAVFDDVKNTPIEIHYKKYPISAPPSKIMNKDVWKNLMKFPFTEKDIKDKLLSSSPKVPAYFNRESVTPAVIDWFYNTWFPRTDEQKLKSLKEFAMYPERVFFILIEEAYLKRKKGEHISSVLVNTGYEMMENVVQSESGVEPQSTPENIEEEGKGTGKIDMPGTKPPEDDKDEEEAPSEDVKSPKKVTQYGLKEPKKVKHPERMKRPSTVQPAIK